MAATRELAVLILKLAHSGKEDEWWDFKKQWSSKEDLVFDVVCLANNTQFRDAYLIVGVDEENDYCFCDVKDDKNRKNTQQLVDLLKSQPFAGDVIPDVQVSTLSFTNGDEIDIVEIKSGKESPYFFRENHWGLNAGAIYTRVRDTNTPKGRSANYRQVEALWRNHFGLADAPIKRLEEFLRDDEGWQDSLEHSEGLKEFYISNPEYTIERIGDEGLDGYEYYHFAQTDSRPSWYEIFVRYHQTVIAGMQGASLDGGRYFTSIPDRAFIQTPSHDGRSLDHLSYSYCYFVDNSLNFLMHCHLYNGDTDDERIAYERFLRSVVLYKDENERVLIEDSITNDPRSFEEGLKGITPWAYISKEHNEVARKRYIESFKTVRYIQDRLEDIRGVSYPCKLRIKEDAPGGGEGRC